MRISERLLAGGSERVADAGADPAAQLRALIAFHVDFALDNPALITVQDRDLGSLPDADAAQVRRLQRRYVEVWVTVLARLHPAADAATCRARAHAVFGLINSTPHSAGRLDRAGDGRPARRHGLGRRDAADGRDGPHSAGKGGTASARPSSATWSMSAELPVGVLGRPRRSPRSSPSARRRRWRTPRRTAPRGCPV